MKHPSYVMMSRTRYNGGDGRFFGEPVEPPPKINKRDIVESETENKVDECKKELETIINKVYEIFYTKKSLSKSDKEVILLGLYRLQRNIYEHLPRTNKMFKLRGGYSDTDKPNSESI